MAVLLLDGVEATGVGRVHACPQTNNHAMEVTFTNSGGSVTALVVDLVGGLDNTVPHSLGTKTFSGGELTAKKAILHVVDKLVDFVSANITTLTETGTTAVSVRWQGK